MVKDLGRQQAIRHRMTPGAWGSGLMEGGKRPLGSTDVFESPVDKKRGRR